MSISKHLRAILGPKITNFIGYYYRRFFINFDNLPNYIPIKSNDVLLDVGGGDGELINLLFKKYHSLSVVMTDIASNIGSAIADEYKNNVKLFPKTDIGNFDKKDIGIINTILICDVIHHINDSERIKFFENIKKLVDLESKIIIIDVNPYGWKSKLGFISDRYLSGDKNTKYITQRQMITLVKTVFSNIKCRELDLYLNDPPNYALEFYFTE